MAVSNAEVFRPEHQVFLRDDLERRCAKNPNYSLRAFARDLALSPSHLSGVLAGHYGLSRQAAVEIAKRLSLSAAEAEIFLQSVESRHARSKTMREAATEKLLKLTKKNSVAARLKLDHFKVIADWFHFAILELTFLKRFQSNVPWIAKALNLHPDVADRAVRRLKRLKMLNTDNETWTASTESTETGFEIPSSAIRTFHSQILEKASEALQFQPMESRDFRSTVLAIRKERLPEAKRAIEKLHRDFCSDISDSHSVVQDEVYCLSTQFFSVTSHQENNS